MSHYAVCCVTGLYDSILGLYKKENVSTSIKAVTNQMCAGSVELQLYFHAFLSIVHI